MSLSLNAAEVRALAWVEEKHRGQGCEYKLEHFVDTAMVGWVHVRVRLVGHQPNMRPDRHYVMSTIGRVWSAARPWAIGAVPERGELLRDKDYDTAGL
jgi:hypothetical protein